MPRVGQRAIRLIDAYRSTTTNPWTTNFDHMLPTPKSWSHKFRPGQHPVNAVPLKERIKYWNIVPGDQIVITGRPVSEVHEVMSIDRLSNRVFLRETLNVGGDAPGSMNEQDDSKSKNKKGLRKRQKPQMARSVNYNDCKLFMGRVHQPRKDDPTQTDEVDVFSADVKMTKPKWDKVERRWVWDRQSTVTVPVFRNEETGKPDYTKSKGIKLDWPAYKPKHPPPTSYDTAEDAVLEETFALSPLREDESIHSAAHEPASEDEYIRRLWNQDQYDNSMLTELHLQQELSNPNSRAKRQKRWQAKLEADRALFDVILADERKYGRHKSKTAATHAARQKLRAHLHAERKKERVRRAVVRGDVAKREAKKEKKTKKKAKRDEQLRNLVLQEGKNQFIPRELEILEAPPA